MIILINIYYQYILNIVIEIFFINLMIKMILYFEKSNAN